MSEFSKQGKSIKTNADVEKWLDRDAQVSLADLGLKQGDYVLDFGCGGGHYTIPAAKTRGKGARHGR